MTNPTNLLFKLIFIISLLFSNTCLMANNSGAQLKIEMCQDLLKASNYNQALTLSNNLIKRNKSLRESYICKAKAEIGLNQNKEAINTLNQALKITKQALDKMVTLTLMGNAELTLALYVEAKSHFQTVFEIAEQQKDKGFQRIALSLLGATEFKQTNNAQAINHYLASLKLAANDNERADIYSHISEIYASQQQYDLAIEYQLKATIALKHYGDLERQVESELLLADLYVNAKQYQQAQSLLEKLLNFSLENQSPYFAAKSYLGLGRNSLANNQQSNAKKFLEEAKKQSKELNDDELNQEVIKLFDSIQK